MASTEAKRNYRGYSADIEALATAWRATPVTSEAWVADRTMFSGSAGGLHVACGDTRGFAKPFAKKTDGCPRAAHEKIASDLAYDLDLPVPPVVLWHRAAPTSQERFCAISAVPFNPVLTWGQVKAAGAASRVAKAISPHASAMSVFDCWVDNRDRLNEENLLVSEAGGKVSVAYIDYSLSLSYGWAAAATDPSEEPGRYPTNADADAVAAQETMKAIEALPEANIRAIINRVPGDFLSPDRRTRIEDGLLNRRTKLRDIVRQMYGGA